MAKNVRVHQLATELGMTNDEVVNLCERLGVPVKSHSSSLNEACADMVRRRAHRDGLTRDEQPIDDARVAPLTDRGENPLFGQPQADQRIIVGPRRDLRSVSGPHAPRPLDTSAKSQLSDPFMRAEELFPYPVAALVRATRVSDDPHERREAYLKLGESLVRAYGLVAGSAEGQSPEQTLGTGKITTGKWIGEIRHAIATGRAVPVGFSWENKTGSVGWHLTQLVALRNRSHHKQGVDSAHQASADVEQARRHITAVLDGSPWLATTRWLGVSRCEFTEQGHVIRARVLRGSDPQWISDSVSVLVPRVPSSVIAMDADSELTIDMSSMVFMSGCDGCRREEIFVLDAVGTTSTFACMAGHSIKRRTTSQ